MADLTNPHDAFFKELFSRREVARDFIAHHLPPEVVELLDLETLEQHAGTFVDEALQESYSDILYRARRVNGGECCVYLLFEHKSRAERFTPLQLLGYQTRIWADCLKADPKLKKLPPILPVVVYHGKSGWRVARNFSELLDWGPDEAALRQYVPDFTYHLFETRTYDERTAQDMALLKIGLAALKYIFESDLGRHLAQYFTLFQEMDETDARIYISVLLHYVTQTAQPVTVEEVEKAVRAAFTQQGEAMRLSIIDQWKLEGRQQGLQEGRQEAWEEAQRRESALLIRLLERRFAALPADMREQVNRLSFAKLEKLGEAIFDFSNIKEVAAWLRRNKA